FFSTNFPMLYEIREMAYKGNAETIAAGLFAHRPNAPKVVGGKYSPPVSLIVAPSVWKSLFLSGLLSNPYTKIKISWDSCHDFRWPSSQFCSTST
ncbi:MAG: hypothetical protein AAFV25_18395, partial [Bacteroidota bacterium]